MGIAAELTRVPRQVDMVNQYMRHAQLPRNLRIKLRTYYELRFPGGRAFDEHKILSELSSPLTQEVRMHKCRQVLSALNIIEQVQRTRHQPPPSAPPLVAALCGHPVSPPPFVPTDQLVPRTGQATRI